MTTADLWERYDALISHIATTAYVDRGENIGGYLAEQRKIADELRAKLIGSVPVPLSEASASPGRSAAPSASLDLVPPAGQGEK